MELKDIILLLGVAAMVMFSAGCIGPGPHPTEIPEPTVEPTTATWERSTQIPQPEPNDNAIFVELVEEMGILVSQNLKDIGTNMGDGEFVLAKNAAARLECLAGLLTVEISDCVVTDDVKPVQTLVLKSLEELRLGSIDAQAGLGTLVDTDELDKASAHFKKAVEYFSQVR